MSDDEDQETDKEIPEKCNSSRPLYRQVKELVKFVQKHPEMVQRKTTYSARKKQKLWTELSNTINSIDGAWKSSEGWIKFWADKRRFLKIKRKRFEEGKSMSKLGPLELKILELSEGGSKKKKSVKEKLQNYHNDLIDGENALKQLSDALPAAFRLQPSDERQAHVMGQLVSAMELQATAMTQLAQTSLNNAKALGRLAEASHVQALCIDRISNTFESICTSVQDVRNSIMSIDYNIKRCYPITTTATQHRSEPSLFS